LKKGEKERYLVEPWTPEPFARSGRAICRNALTTSTSIYYI
jgi:hypothetical protein